MQNRLVGLLGLLLLSISVVRAASEAESTCKSLLLGDVRVELGGDANALVPVKFEGRDVWMILAMSSGLPMLFHGAVKELGLDSRLQPTEWNWRSGPNKVTSQVDTKSLVLGGANFTGWSLQVLPGDSQPLQMHEGEPVVGVLTSAFMNAIDVEFDFAAGMMRLFRHKDCKGPPAHWRGEATSTPLYADASGLLVFSMELEGKKVETSLNTVSPRTVLSSRVSKEFFGFDENSPEISKETVGREQEIVSFHAMSLTAKGVNIRNAPVALRTGDQCKISTVSTAKTGSRVSARRTSGSIGYSNCLNGTPLKLGTDLLKKLRVYLASKESEAYFQSSTSN